MRRLRELATKLTLAGAVVGALALPAGRADETLLPELTANQTFKERFTLNRGTLEMELGKRYTLHELGDKTGKPTDIVDDRIRAVAMSRGMLVTRRVPRPGFGPGYDQYGVVWEPDVYVEANRSGKILTDAVNGRLADYLEGEVKRYREARTNTGNAEAVLGASKLGIELVSSYFTSFGSGAMAKLAEKPLGKLTAEQWKTLGKGAVRSIAETLAPELVQMGWDWADLERRGSKIDTDSKFKEVMGDMLDRGIKDLEGALRLAQDYRSRRRPYTPADAAALKRLMQQGIGRTRAGSAAFARYYSTDAREAINRFLMEEILPHIASGITPLSPATVLIDYERFVSKPGAPLAEFHRVFADELLWFDLQYGEQAAYGGFDLVVPALKHIRPEVEGEFSSPQRVVNYAFRALAKQDRDAFGSCFLDLAEAGKRYEQAQMPDAWDTEVVSEQDGRALLRVRTRGSAGERTEEWRVQKDGRGYWRIGGEEKEKAPTPVEDVLRAARKFSRVDADGWIYPDGVNRNPDGSYAYDFTKAGDAVVAFFEAVKNKDERLYPKLLTFCQCSGLLVQEEQYVPRRNGYTSLLAGFTPEGLRKLDAFKALLDAERTTSRDITAAFASPVLVECLERIGGRFLQERFGDGGRLSRYQLRKIEVERRDRFEEWKGGRWWEKRIEARNWQGPLYDEQAEQAMEVFGTPVEQANTYWLKYEGWQPQFRLLGHDVGNLNRIVLANSRGRWHYAELR